MNIIKCFYAEKQNSYFPSIKKAKEADRSEHVYRVWFDSDTDEEIGRYLVHAYGDMCCPVRDADKYIERIMKNEKRNG